MTLSIFTGLLFCYTLVSAAETENVYSTDLYILTKACPDEYTDYAVSNLQRFISGVNPEELPDEGIITLGTPFSFRNSDSNIFYFPVLCDEEMIYTFRVYPQSSGGYSGILSKGFVNELNALASETNPKTPDTINRSKVVTYANSRSISPTYVTSTLSNSSLISQIVASKPVYLSMYRMVGTEKKYHAIVLRGYAINSSTWSVWNPWYDEYETISMNGTYVPKTKSSIDYTYTYSRTIYNWSR